MPLDHYVSQVHLRNFYSEKLGQRMYAMRKSDLKQFQPNSESICRLEDGNTNKYLVEPRAIEEFLKTVEPNYNAAIEALGNRKPDQSAVHAVAGFVAYVVACSPTGMRLQAAQLRASVEVTGRVLEEQGKIPPAPPALGGKSLSTLIDEGSVVVNVDPKYPQAIGVENILRLTSTFGNCAWEALINPNNDFTFVTSDFPVGFELMDGQVLDRVVPLSPKLAVRIRPDPQRRGKKPDLDFANFSFAAREIGRAEVLSINKTTIRCAEDTIFFQDNHVWLPRLIERNSKFRADTRIEKIPSPTGWYAMTSLIVTDS